MNIYYLDDPLDDGDFTFVKNYLAEKQGLKGIQNINQIRIPTVLPSEHTLIDSEGDTNKVVALLTAHLKKAGMERDTGKQVFWVMPKEDTHWGLRFQISIETVTGYMPYVVQRWYCQEDGLVRGDMRILDIHGLMYGKLT